MKAYLQSIMVILGGTYITKISRDIVLPALPIIADAYLIDTNQAQVTITAYFLGIAMARFIWPYIADKTNTKHLLLGLHLAFIFVTPLCLIKQISFNFFILGRALQAFFLAGIPLILRTSILKKHGTNKTIKLYSYLSILSAWSTAIATSIGGILVFFGYWQLIFYLLLILILVNFLVLAYCLPNEMPPEEHKLNLLKSYQYILQQKHFWQIAIPFACQIGCNTAYMAITPFILVKSGIMSSSEYGLSFFVLMTGSVIGRMLAGKIIDYLSIINTLRFASCLTLLSSLIALFFTMFYSVNSYSLIFISAFIYLATGMTAPTAKTLISTYNKQFRTTYLGALTTFESIFSVIITSFAVVIIPSWSNLFELIATMNCIGIMILFWPNKEKNTCSIKTL